MSAIFAGLTVWALAQGSGNDLEKNFKEPPDSAKPRVWWHWMNGNVTKEGITADLEWMKRVGFYIRGWWWRAIQQSWDP